MSQQARVESFNCSECGSIDMVDVTGLTNDDIIILKECPYICKHCLRNMYPEYYGEENSDDSGIHNETDD